MVFVFQIKEGLKNVVAVIDYLKFTIFHIMRIVSAFYFFNKASRIDVAFRLLQIDHIDEGRVIK
jgi:hypothetical protein